MIQKQAITQLPNSVFHQLGWDYFVSGDAADYLTSELVVVQESESEALYQAANRLYDLLVQTGERILQEGKLDDLGIPKNLHELIRLSWDDDGHLHLFGRFDFAGGTGDLPPKLLEFNADTPTSLPETAIIQWAQLRANNIDDKQQFNFVFDSLIEQFRRLRALHPQREPGLLVSTLRGAPEDDNNVSLLSEAAREAGFAVTFRYVDEVVFSEEEGIFAVEDDGSYQPYPFWFKLVPWEYIAEDEPELCAILTKITRRGLAVVLNPAYTMIFQSKAILKFLWDYFPQEATLLETTLKEPIGRTDFPYVKKVLFGREGANVTIHNAIGIPEEIRGGDYAAQASVYQELAQLDQDAEGYYYQAGVFFAYEACGLGFRRAQGRIMDDGAQFVGHRVIPG